MLLAGSPLPPGARVGIGVGGARSCPHMEPMACQVGQAALQNIRCIFTCWSARNDPEGS